MALYLNDWTSNANDLTNVNSATEYTSDFPFAASTEAVQFASASNQWLRAADSASLSVTGNLTLECWVKRTTTGAVHTLISKWNPTGNLRSYELRLQSDDTIEFRISNDGVNQSSKSTTDTITGTSWHYIAVVYTASTGAYQFYIDGSASQSGTGMSTSIFDSTARLGIGGEDAGSDTPTNPINAKMDEIRIWNATRTSTQISNNYNIKLTGSESGLVGYYPLESPTSPSASQSPSASTSPSASSSASASRSASASASSSLSPSSSASSSASASASKSLSPSASQSPSASLSPSSSTSKSASASASRSASASISPSSSASPSSSGSPSKSPSRSLSVSSSVSSSPSPTDNSFCVDQVEICFRTDFDDEYIAQTTSYPENEYITQSTAYPENLYITQSTVFEDGYDICE